MKIYLALILTLLTACATGPNSTGPTLVGSVINIERVDLEKYWIEADKKNSNRFEAIIYAGDGKCKKFNDDLKFKNDIFITHTYLIDSNGRSYDHSFSDALGATGLTPENLKKSATLYSIIGSAKYNPSNSNVNMAPVRVATKLYQIESSGACS